MAHVDIEHEVDDTDEATVVAKITDDGWEINVRARASEFLVLRAVRTFDWETRQVARVGTCAGASVFWCSDTQMVTIMVGQDDETWDIAVSVPVQVVDDLVRQVEL